MGMRLPLFLKMHIVPTGLSSTASAPATAVKELSEQLSESWRILPGRKREISSGIQFKCQIISG
jgi:hypothetical protein